MTALSDLLATSRAFAFREGVLKTLAAAFPEVEVKALPGRLQVEDLDKADMFSPPAMRVTVARIRPAEHRMSGERDVPVEVMVWIIVEDRVVANRLAYRDEIGLALCDGVLALLETPAGRWGLDDIGMPEDAEAKPVLSVMTESRGTAYFVAGWWQKLYGQGQPFMDMDSVVPADATARAILPGDPGWVPPGDTP